MIGLLIVAFLGTVAATADSSPAHHRRAERCPQYRISISSSRVSPFPASSARSWVAIGEERSEIAPSLTKSGIAGNLANLTTKGNRACPATLFSHH
jgi:hypothetical protein